MMLARSGTDKRGQELDVRPIRGLLEQIVTELRPLEIRLFGSRARGDAKDGSDWDLFVVVPDGERAADDPFAGYHLRRRTRARADVIVASRADYAEDRDTPNTLAYEASHFGVSIYER